MAKAKIQDMALPDGSPVKAVEVPFEVVTEAWNEYMLPGGAQTRVKNILTKIFVIVDEAGVPIPDSSGDSQVIIQGTIAVTVSGTVENEP